MGLKVWLYVQATGELFRPDGTLCGKGYAGKSAGKNQPGADHVRNTGPLPGGLYEIGLALNHERLGPISIPLGPCRWNRMYTRSAFYMHGDSVSAPGTASDGCICMSRTIRVEFAAARGQLLWVVPYRGDLGVHQVSET